MSMSATTRRVLKYASVRLFLHADRLGVHVLPKHYYSSLPDYSWLDENRAVWRRRVDLTGMHWNISEQLTWLRRHCEETYHEVKGLKFYTKAEHMGYGPGYGPIESQLLHCVCRAVKPRRWIEVGSGVSTLCTLNALKLNTLEGSSDCEVMCIEPFPNKTLTEVNGAQLVRQAVQTLPLTTFEALGPGDVLFIDSTHAVKTGSDVQYLLLEVIPRLRPGVLVHIHDIFLPYLHRPDILTSYFDWQETTLLLALLKGNRTLNVRACLSALHHDAPKQLNEALGDYNPTEHFPTSIWLEVGE